MVQRQVSDIWSRDELPCEVNLGWDRRYHSVFTCPILRQQTTGGRGGQVMAVLLPGLRAKTGESFKSNHTKGPNAFHCPHQGTFGHDRGSGSTFGGTYFAKVYCLAGRKANLQVQIDVSLYVCLYTYPFWASHVSLYVYISPMQGKCEHMVDCGAVMEDSNFLSSPPPPLPPRIGCAIYICTYYVLEVIRGGGDCPIVSSRTMSSSTSIT